MGGHVVGEVQAGRCQAGGKGQSRAGRHQGGRRGGLPGWQEGWPGWGRTYARVTRHAGQVLPQRGQRPAACL